MYELYQFVRSGIRLACLLFILSASEANSQEVASVIKISPASIRQIYKEVGTAQEQLARKMSQQLHRLEKQERKLYKKLMKSDSAAARQLFKDAPAQYAQLRTDLSAIHPTPGLEEKIYLPVLDSLQAAFNFLSANASFPASGVSSNPMTALASKFSAADKARQFFEQRKQFLTEQLKPLGWAQKLIPFKKEVFYYQQHLAAFKDAFSQSTRAQEKLLAMLNKLPAFNKFFTQHSQLSGLFQLPGSGDGVTNIVPGSLQTRSSVMGQVTAIMGSNAGVNDLLKQNLNQAQSMVNQLKDKINQFGSGGNSDMEMPDFKVNGQHTKSFLKRVELGMNVQSQKGNSFLPSSSDIGFSAGYKLNDKSIIGIGASYKMGWGKGIQDIAITSEGAGLRSFIELKLKGSLWLAGGSEFNYRSRFKSIAALKDHSGWQQSALVGLSKKFDTGKKLKATMQLLYDVLYRQQVPQTQPVVFRIGYRFK